MPRILTYNVHSWIGTDWRVSPERIAEVIAACEADVVALQEVRVGRARVGGLDQAAAVAHALGMKLFFQPTGCFFGELFGIAVMTAHPARLVKGGALPNPTRSLSLEARSALWVSVDTAEGELQVVNTHLGLRGGKRLVQAEALLGKDWLGHEECRGPAVLVGDLNAKPGSAAYARLATRLRDAQLATPEPGPQATFPSRLPLRRIDHVLVSEGIEVLGAAAIRTPLARIASDHLPLMADLRISSAVQFMALGAGLAVV